MDKLYFKGHRFYKAYEERCWELGVEPRFKTFDEFNDALVKKQKELGRSGIQKIGNNTYKVFEPANPFRAATALAEEQVEEAK